MKLAHRYRMTIATSSPTQRRIVESRPEKENVLKLDKDCHVSSQLEREYVRQTVTILRKHHLRVVWIKATTTHHGRHYRIKIDPPVDAHTANNLQYTLGDDPMRVDFNRARVNSRLAHWNILFEVVGRKMTTLYPRKGAKAAT
jgi:hypothetical protein